jgi:hypothetical protein
VAEETVDIKFNIDDLTLGELADMEDVTGLTLDKMNLAKPSAKMLLAMLWVFEKRSNPKYTYTEARQVKVTALGEFTKKLGKSQSAA